AAVWARASDYAPLAPLVGPHQRFAQQGRAFEGPQERHPVERQEDRGDERSHRRRSRDVHEQGGLAEMVPVFEDRDPAIDATLTPARDRDSSANDQEEGTPRVALVDDDALGRRAQRGELPR